MSIAFFPGIGNQQWDEGTVYAKLNNIATADKTKQWIQHDLSTPQAGEFGKCFWKVVAKHFQFMRGGLYHVDVDASKNILERLGVIVLEHPGLSSLFMRAVENFERITQRHVEVPPKLFADTVCRLQQPVPPLEPKRVVVQPEVIVREPVIIEEPSVVVSQPVPFFVPPSPPIVVTPPPIFTAPPVVTRRPVFATPVVVGGDGPGIRNVCSVPVADPRPRVVPGTGVFGFPQTRTVVAGPVRAVPEPPRHVVSHVPTPRCVPVVPPPAFHAPAAPRPVFQQPATTRPVCRDVPAPRPAANHNPAAHVNRVVPGAGRGMHVAAAVGGTRRR